MIRFSADTYTSLGFGDLVPQGHLHHLTGVETLNGLLLIGWTASFLYQADEFARSAGKTRPVADPPDRLI